MPRMTHPDLPGRTIDVDAVKAVNRRSSGWVDVVDRPAVNDPKPDWVDYAQTCGVDTAGLTKKQLIDATTGDDVPDAPDGAAGTPSTDQES